MATYPIEPSDTEGITDAVNYLLSGPAGLGQNFEGFSAYLPAYLRPSRRQPWSLPITSTLNPSIYLEIPISNAAPVGGNPSALIILTFTTPQATAPFAYGDRVDVSGVIDDGGGNPPYSYDDTGYTVYECTTTDVTLTFYGSNGAVQDYDWANYISGGQVGRDYMNFTNDTECNGRVTVTGPTTQVFVSAQLNLEWQYTCTTANDYDVVVAITRSRGFPTDIPGSNDYLFADTVLISEKTFTNTATVGTGSHVLEAIFTTVLDGPNLDFGYYWYILTVRFDMPGGIFVDTDSRDFDLSGIIDPISSSFSGIVPTLVTGTGSGLVVDVSLDSGDVSTYNTSTNTTIDIVSGGSGYRVGDTLLILGTDLGGASPANDMILVVNTVSTPYDITIGPATTGLRSLTAQVIKQ